MTGENEHEDNKKGKTHVQWIAAIIANTTFLTHGIQVAVFTSMIAILRDKDKDEIFWIASSLSFAACFGVGLFAYIITICGRKKTIIIIAVMQTLCWILKICSSSTVSLIFARVFAGLAGGGCFSTVPLYVREIAQDNLRGILGSIFVLLQNVGFLVTYAMGFYLDYYLILWIVVWIPVITAVLMFFAPESPPFLMKKGLIDEATSTLARLRGLDVKNNNIKTELRHINQETNIKLMPNVNIWRLFSNLALFTITGICGISAISTFTHTILELSGVTVKPELEVISFPIVMIVASLISMCFIEIIGRKKLLTTALIIGFLSLVILATIMLIQEKKGYSPGWISIVPIIAYLIVYGGAISSLPYIILAESFNFQIRAIVVGVLVTYGRVASCVHVLSLISIVNNLGLPCMFYCYAVINLIGAVITYKYLPETKGTIVEENEVTEERNSLI